MQVTQHWPDSIMALQTGAKLVVLNLSQQTDSADLLGGFMPLDPKEALMPLLPEFQVHHSSTPLHDLGSMYRLHDQQIPSFLMATMPQCQKTV